VALISLVFYLIMAQNGIQHLTVGFKVSSCWSGLNLFYLCGIQQWGNATGNGWQFLEIDQLIKIKYFCNKIK
jgi:hypothetical protein